MTSVEEDPYADLKRHVWPRDAPPPLRRRTAIHRKRRHFVKVPVVWVERLTAACRLATYRLALHLLYLAWKTNSGSIVLPNSALAAEGVSRKQKWRALLELEQLGLVAIERRQRKAPRVALLDHET